DHYEYETNHQPREFLDATVEARFLLLPGEAAGDVTEVGVRTGRNHDCLGRAALDARSKKTGVAALQEADAFTRVRRFHLFDRKRFTRQRGLNDDQIFSGDQSHTGGNHVAGRQLDDVTWDKL